MSNFKFQVSNERNEKTLWLCFENGLVNLNLLAESKPGIIGKQLREAIKREILEISPEAGKLEGR
jgi:hypothetical protein